MRGSIGTFEFWFKNEILYKICHLSLVQKEYLTPVLIYETSVICDLCTVESSFLY